MICCQFWEDVLKNRFPFSQRTESAAHRHIHHPGPQAISSSQQQSMGPACQPCKAWLSLVTEDTSLVCFSADAKGLKRATPNATSRNTMVITIFEMFVQWPIVESSAVVIPNWSDKHRRLPARFPLNLCASVNRWCTSSVLKDPVSCLAGVLLRDRLQPLPIPTMGTGTTRHIDKSRYLQFEAHPAYDQHRHIKQQARQLE